MILSKKLDELHAYIDKVGEDLRKELDLAASPDSTVGISFDPTIQVTRVPNFTMLEPGFYRLKNGESLLEIINQNQTTGALTVIDNEGRLDVITHGLFCFLYELLK